jgi:hypothetical protein
MPTMLYSILNRERSSSASYASPNHFSLDDGQIVAPRLLLEESNWTPYCLDDANRRVFFVSTPPTFDLSHAAFVYTTQFETAERVLAVPYTALEDLLDELESPQTLILIYSMGRCGTTLMSQILNQINAVYSLSEPDIFSNLVYLRLEDRSRDAELGKILKAATLLLMPRGAQPQRNVLALKFRSNVIELSDLFYKVFPDARNIFMYRNAVSWAQSVSRFLQRLNYPNQLSYEDSRKLWNGINGADPVYLEPYMDAQTELFHFSDLLAPAWTSYLDRYIHNYELGVPFYNIRYEELNQEREATLTAAFNYCRLPLTALEIAMQAFEKDSQEGTEIARDIPTEDMSAERVEAFLQMLVRHPRFNQPDFILPTKLG